MHVTFMQISDRWQVSSPANGVESITCKAHEKDWNEAYSNIRGFQAFSRHTSGVNLVSANTR